MNRAIWRNERHGPHDVLVVDHPAVADRLARLRDRDAPVPVFRRMVEEIGLFLAYEATRSLRTADGTVQTPLEPAPARRIARRPVVSPILRAGLGLLAGLPRLHRRCRGRAPRVLPRSDSLEPVPYYANMPRSLADRDVFVLDPMLATGNSGSAAMRCSTRAARERSRSCA